MKKNWYKNLKIKNKIIVIFLPLIIVPLLITGYISNQIASETIITKTKKNIYDNSNLIITRIEGKLFNCESCANLLSLNLSKAINDIGKDGSENQELDLTNRIGQQISYALLVFKDVEAAAFIDNNGKIFTSKYEMEENLDEALNSNIFNAINKSNGINLYFPVEKRNYLTVDKEKPVYTLGKKIFNLTTGEKIGYLILTLKEESLSNIFKNIGPVPQNSYFIVDERNIIISSSKKVELLKPLTEKLIISKLSNTSGFAIEMKYDGKNSLVTSSKFNKNDWKLLSVSPIEVLTSDTTKITLISAFTIIICLVIALIGTSKLSSKISKPIVKLKNRMLEVSNGNLNVSFETNSIDEIGLLGKGFNIMVSQVKDLIQKVNVEEKKKREFEFALITSQIKPHFLYNTLDVIYVLAGMKRYDDVQKTTKALADFYRVALSKGEELVTIEGEIKNIKDYLFIQRTRYADIFDYTINVDENILQYAIPKLSIQPLVEHSIYHGLKTKNEFGTIKIYGKVEMEDVILSIEDDGVGMTAEVIEKIMASNKSNINHISFGIYSTDRRIKLYFGNAYGVTISSEINVGTKFTITIPKVRRGDTIV